MSSSKKMTMLQLEKAYEIATRAKIKLQLIERNKSTIFPCEDDYLNLKENYSLEREYALKKCRDIVATDKDLSSRKKWYDFFKSYYESKQLVRDIAFLFVPFIVVTILLGYYYSQSLLWMIACLDLIAIGAAFGVYAYSNSGNKKKTVDDKEYLAPTSMQIKILREIDKKLLNGEIYEDIIKDCQLQFAKRRLAEARTNNLTNSVVINQIEENVNIEEDIVDIFFGKEPTVKYSYDEVKTKKKASNSGVYERYMAMKNSSKKKTEVIEETPVVELTPVVESIKTPKKKASESSVYAKYMSMKNSKKEEAKETSSESSPTPSKAVRYSFDKVEGAKAYNLSSYKDNKIVKKFVSSLDIIRTSEDVSITKEANITKAPKKKASESATYQRYMEMKLARQEAKK